MFRASLVVGAILSLLCSTTQAQTTVPSGQPFKGELLEGMGDHHHPVSTTNAQAQKFFDQGLSLMYGFNYDEAMRSFMRAAELDPGLAMAHWGIAMTLGPNYNIDVDPPREKAAFQAVQKALQLSAAASQHERDYITTLARRFSNDPNPELKKLALDYKNGMAELSRKYPDDLDAATLYAESMMLLRPWHLWTRDGKPAEGTLELVAVLESVLKRDPDHIGANHLHIHAVEGSSSPERALESAGRLPGLAPASGHLVHMPSHIYSRTGDQESAASSNVLAAEADERYLKTRNDMGVYPMMYYGHNLHFLAYAHAAQGRFADAKAAADKLSAYSTPHLKHMPLLDGYAAVPIVVLMRFEKWDQLLKLADPGEGRPVSRLNWRLARSLAYANAGNPADAEQERRAMNDLARTLPPDAMISMLNQAGPLTRLFDSYAGAHIALANKDAKAAIELLGQAVHDEDALSYEEPPPWWLSARESLGAVLMREGHPADAEVVFRRELEYYPRDGRTLFGLMNSLKAQGRSYDADWVERQFKAAWKNADSELKPPQR